MPEPGSEVEAGSTFGVVESVKAASDVYSPISGTVVEANTELSSSPGHVRTRTFVQAQTYVLVVGKPLGSILRGAHLWKYLGTGKKVCRIMIGI